MGSGSQWTADNYVRFVKYYAGNVVLVRGLRGATADLTWRFGPVSRLRFHRPASFLPHRLRPAALRLPDDNGYAIHPPEALRAANRKTGIVMPEIQNQNHPANSSTLYADAKFLRGLSAAYNEYLADPTLADAILDRLVHQAHKLDLKGESLRKNKATDSLG